MIETIADRIKKRMDELKIKQVDLINKKVASKGTISLWLSGGAVPSGERLVKLCNELNVDAGWILMGQRDITSRTIDSIDLSTIANASFAPVISWAQVGAWNNMENIELTGDEEQLPLVPGAGKRSFYLRVNGISNSPFYADGEKICIDPDYSIGEIQTGEMVVVSINGEATFKALLRSENRIFLKALNKDWQPNIVEINENCLFVGKYVGSFKVATRHIL